MYGFNQRAFFSRSNWILVKDPDVFREMLDRYKIDLWGPDEDDGRCAFGTTGSLDFFLLSEHDQIIYTYDDSGEPFEETTLSQLVAPHLCEGEVCIVQEVGVGLDLSPTACTGVEGFIVGMAIAFDSTGKTEIVDIDEIQKKVRRHFKGSASPPEVAWH